MADDIFKKNALNPSTDERLKFIPNSAAPDLPLDQKLNQEIQGSIDHIRGNGFGVDHFLDEVVPGSAAYVIKPVFRVVEPALNMLSSFLYGIAGAVDSVSQDLENPFELIDGLEQTAIINSEERQKFLEFARRPTENHKGMLSMINDINGRVQKLTISQQIALSKKILENANKRLQKNVLDPFLPGDQGGNQMTFSEIFRENGMREGLSLSDLDAFHWLYTDTGTMKYQDEANRTKAALQKKIQEENPDWTDEQVAKGVEREFNPYTSAIRTTLKRLSLKRGGILDPNERGTAGFLTDVGMDVTTYVTFGTTGGVKVVAKTGSAVLSKSGMQRLGKVFNDLADFDGTIIKIKATELVTEDEGGALLRPYLKGQHGLDEAVDAATGKLTREELILSFGDELPEGVDKLNDWQLRDLVRQKLYSDGLDVSKNPGLAVTLLERVRNVADDLVVSEAKANPKLVTTWIGEAGAPIANIGFLGLGETPIIIPGKILEKARDIRYNVRQRLGELKLPYVDRNTLLDNAEKGFSIYRQILQKGLTKPESINDLVGEAQGLFFKVNKQLDAEATAIEQARRLGRISEEVANGQITRLSEIRDQVIVRSRVLQFAGKNIRESKTWVGRLKDSAKNFIANGVQGWGGLLPPEMYSQAIRDMARLAGYSLEKADQFAGAVQIYKFLGAQPNTPWKKLVTLETEDAGGLTLFKGNAKDFELDEEAFLARFGTLERITDDYGTSRWDVAEIRKYMSTEQFVEFAKRLMKAQKPVDDADFIIALQTKFTAIDNFMERESKELSEKFAGKDISLVKLDNLFSKDYQNVFEFAQDEYWGWSEGLRKLGLLKERGDVKWRKVYDAKAASAKEASSIDDVLYYDRTIDETENGVYKAIRDSRQMADAIALSLRPAYKRLAERWGHNAAKYATKASRIVTMQFATIANAFRGRFTKLHSADPLFRRMYDTVATRIAHEQVQLFDEIKTVFSKVDPNNPNKLIELDFSLSEQGMQNRKTFWEMLHGAGRITDAEDLKKYWMEWRAKDIDNQLINAAEWVHRQQMEVIAYQLKELGIPTHLVNWDGRILDDAAYVLRASDRNEVFAARWTNRMGPGNIFGITYNVGSEEFKAALRMIRVNTSNLDMVRKIDALVVRDSKGRFEVLSWEVKEHLEKVAKELRDRGEKIPDLRYAANSNPAGITYIWMRDQKLRIEWERFKRLLNDRVGRVGLFTPRDFDTLAFSKVAPEVEERIREDLIRMMDTRLKDTLGVVTNAPRVVEGDAVREYLKAAKSQVEREEVIRQLLLMFPGDKDFTQKVLLEGAVFGALPDLRDINRAGYFKDPLVDVALADGSTISLPRAMQKDLDNLPLALRQDKSFVGLLKMWDSMTQAFKTMYTVIDPAFVFRNAYSNVMLHFLGHGLNFANNYRLSMRLLGKVVPSGKIKLSNGITYTYAQVREAALRYGIIRDSAEKAGIRTVETVETAFANSLLFLEKRPWYRKWQRFAGKRYQDVLDYFPGPLPAKVGRRLSGAFENHERLSFFLNELKRGSSFEEAAANVNRFLVDYDNLGTFEAGVKRFGIPFFTWFRNMLPVVITEAVKKPGRASLFNKAFPIVEEEEQLYIATFRRSDGTVIRVNKDGTEIEAFGTIESPISTLRLLDPIGQVLMDGQSAKVGLGQFLGPGPKILLKFLDDDLGPDLQPSRERADALIGLLDSANVLPGISFPKKREHALRQLGIYKVESDSFNNNPKYFFERNELRTVLTAVYLGRAGRNWNNYFRAAAEDPATHIPIIDAILQMATTESTYTGASSRTIPQQVGINEDAIQRLYEIKLRLQDLGVSKGITKPYTIPVEVKE